jgi:hypothetical protein
MAKGMQSVGIAAVAAFLSVAALLLISRAAVAQNSPPYYVNREYRFAIIFPSEPRARDITFRTFSGDPFPARQFYVEQGAARFSVTVADFSAGPAVDQLIVFNAAAALRPRGEVLLDLARDYGGRSGMPGRQLDILEANGHQLRASVYMWDHRLFITEASAAPGSSDALQFTESITLLGPDGNPV